MTFLIEGYLNESMNETTVIIIAQRVASAKGASNIIVLDDGMIVANGTNDELLKNSPIYQDIYNSQLKQDDTEMEDK